MAQPVAGPVVQQISISGLPPGASPAQAQPVMQPNNQPQPEPQANQVTGVPIAVISAEQHITGPPATGMIVVRFY